MKVFIYANCQGAGFASLLPIVSGRTDLEFSRVENFEVMRGNVSVDSFIDDLRAADLLLYQPVGPQHGFLSTMPGEDNIFATLREGADAVAIPYVYLDALWPFFEDGTGLDNGGVFERLLHEGATLPDLIEAYDSGALDFGFAGRMSAAMDRMAVREADLDFGITDFLREHALSRELMLTHNHPSTEVFRELTTRLCGVLGFPQREVGPLERNLARLPGRYPLDAYSLLSGITYQRHVDDHAGDYYRALLTRFADTRVPGR